MLTVLAASAVAGDADRRGALSRVVPTDGISRTEADAIASFYFYDYVRVGCGTVGDAEDAGDVWRFPAYHGAGGAADGAVLVDKISGSVTWANHPSVPDPLSMLVQPSNSAVQPTRACGPRG